MNSKGNRFSNKFVRLREDKLEWKRRKPEGSRMKLLD